MSVWICKYSKRFFRQKFFLMLLLAMPVGTFFFSYMARQEDTSVRVGLVWSETSPMGGRIGGELMKHPGIVRFYRMESDTELRQAIRRGEMECGYSFPDDMDEKYESRQYDGVVTQYFRRGSMLYAVAGEVVMTGIFRQHAEDLAVSYIRESGLFRSESIGMEEIHGSYRRNLEDQTTFTFSFNNSTKVENKLENYLVAPIRGCVALLILLAGFCGLSLYLQDRSREIPDVLHGRIRRWLSVLSIAVPVLFVTLAGIVSEGLCGDGFLTGKEIAYLVIYDIMVVFFCNLLSHGGIQEGLLWVLALGYVCACALLAPVFINLSALVPGIKPLSYLCLPHYFLEAVFGGGKEFMQLLLLPAILIGADYAASRVRGHHKLHAAVGLDKRYGTKKGRGSE